jgi:hypothetical protein
MHDTYETWLDRVRAALNSMNMPMDAWQQSWPFDFSREYEAGTEPDATAEKANRFWWHQQNKSLNQDCQKTPNCWLPRNHQNECQPQS